MPNLYLYLHTIINNFARLMNLLCYIGVHLPSIVEKKLLFLEDPADGALRLIHSTLNRNKNKWKKLKTAVIILYHV